jgi:hypothetical protein
VAQKILITLPPFTNLLDARNLTQRAVQDAVDKLQAQPPITDFKQHRLLGVVDPQAPDDAATKQYVDKSIASVVAGDIDSGALGGSASVVGVTQATIPPSTSTGTILWVSDYNHLIRWSGTAWQMVDGGNGQIAFFTADPGLGWHLCDGSTVNFLNADCVSLGTIILPDLRTTGATFLKTGTTYTGNVVTRTAPTNGTPSTTTTFTQGAGANVTVASQTHVHTISLPGDPINALVMLPYFRQ